MVKATRVLILIFLALAGVFTVFAQIETGTILGTVVDESGAVIPSATIIVTNKGTGVARSLTSNAEGIYSAPALAAGQYLVHIEMQGFQAFEQNAEVQAGSSTTVNVKMSIGAAQQVVTVEAATAQMNYDSNTVQGVIQRQNIQDLPLNGRSFLQLAQLEPGITVSTGGANQTFSVSTLGGISGKMHYMVDGVSIDDAVTGGNAMNLSQEVVQEFQLSQVNFDVSTGITSTGAVNVVTRSGSNAFHGSAYFFYRDHNMAAYPNLRRSAINPSPFFARRNPGFWISGPLIKNKLFFFYNYEYTDQTQAVSYQPDLASVAGIGGIFSSPYVDETQTARVDYHLSDKHNLFFRFSHEGDHTFGLYFGSGQGNPSWWTNNVNQADDAVLGVTSSFTPTMVNDLRLAFFFWHYNNTQATDSQCEAPCFGAGLPPIAKMVGSSNFNIGAHDGLPQGFAQRRGEVSDVLAWQKGAHRLKFGGDITFETTLNRWQWCTPFCTGVYSPEVIHSTVPTSVLSLFPDLPSVVASNADVLNLPVYNAPPVVQGAGIPFGSPFAPSIYNRDQEQWSNRPHLFAQDVWKVTPSLTVNYGIAYQISFGLFNSDIPEPAFLAPMFGANNLHGTSTNFNNFAPAAGFAYALGKDQKTVIRGGAGIYWDANILNNRAQSLGATSPLGNGYQGFGANVLTNIFPGIVELNGTQQVPLPIGASLPIAKLTNMTLGQFIQIYNQEAPGLRQLFGGGPLPGGGVQLSSAVPKSGPYTVSGIDVAKQGVSIMPPEFPLTRSYQMSIGVQRDLGHDMVLTADYARRVFVNVGDVALDYNHSNEYVNGVQSPLIPSCGTTPNYTVGVECSNGAITVFTDEGRAVYNGLLIKLNKRFSKRYQFVASYAYATDFSTATSQANTFNLNNYFASYGDVVARHNLNIAGFVDLPWGVQLSLDSSIISPQPTSALLPSIDLTGTSGYSNPIPGTSFLCFSDGCGKGQLESAVSAFNATYAGTKAPNGNAIPALVLPPNYTFASPVISQSFRLTKTFSFKERYKFAFFGEVFNAFNIANHAGYSTTLDTKSATPATQHYAFGQATSDLGQTFGSGGPRAIQIGGRFTF